MSYAKSTFRFMDSIKIPSDIHRHFFFCAYDKND